MRTCGWLHTRRGLTGWLLFINDGRRQTAARTVPVCYALRKRQPTNQPALNHQHATISTAIHEPSFIVKTLHVPFFEAYHSTLYHKYKIQKYAKTLKTFTLIVLDELCISIRKIKICKIC